VASIVLTALTHDPAKRAAMALRFDEALIARARALGWRVGEFSRAAEPAEAKAREGSTLAWGVEQVITNLGQVPDLIFDRGEMGKEPVIRLLAESPQEIVRRVLLLAGEKEQTRP
jgi:hydroxymethylpyrimidine/phosphomethylpyrimidine kinase